MRSGHGKARVARIVFSFAVVLGLTLRAQAAPLRVAIFDPDNRELRARVEGQTRDLPLRLVWIAPYVGRLPSARELEQTGKEQGASFVVSVAASASGGLTVQVYDVVRQQLRTRTVPAPRTADRFGASTSAETAALIIRSELRAGLIGNAMPDEESGVETDESPPASTAGDSQTASGGTPSASGTAPAPAARPNQATREPPSREASRQPDRRPSSEDSRSPAEEDEDEPERNWGLPETTSVDPRAARAPARPDRLYSLALGLRASAPGSGLFFGGAWLAARLELHGFELGLAASSTLPAELQNDALRITLRRHAIGADLLALALSGPAVELWFGASGGVVLHARGAAVLDEVRETTPNHTAVGAVFAALAELRFRLAHNLGISARTGLDLLPAAPRFTYERAGSNGQRDSLAKLRAFEPFLILALFVRTWH